MTSYIITTIARVLIKKISSSIDEENNQDYRLVYLRKFYHFNRGLID